MNCKKLRYLLPKEQKCFIWFHPYDIRGAFIFWSPLINRFFASHIFRVLGLPSEEDWPKDSPISYSVSWGPKVSCTKLLQNLGPEENDLLAVRNFFVFSVFMRCCHNPCFALGVAQTHIDFGKSYFWNINLVCCVSVLQINLKNYENMISFVCNWFNTKAASWIKIKVLTQWWHEMKSQRIKQVQFSSSLGRHKSLSNFMSVHLVAGWPHKNKNVHLRGALDVKSGDHQSQ